MDDIWFVLKMLGMLIGGLLICLAMFSSVRHESISEYEIYGEQGEDEWTRHQMGMTKEEYEDFKKNGYQN